MSSKARSRLDRRVEQRQTPRAEAELRHRLLAALYHRRRRQAERVVWQLERLLGPAAASDGDLAIAHGWLAEERRREAERWEEARRTSLKLAVTGAPLVAATLLSGLLAAVIVFSG